MNVQQMNGQNLSFHQKVFHCIKKIKTQPQSEIYQWRDHVMKKKKNSEIISTNHYCIEIKKIQTSVDDFNFCMHSDDIDVFVIKKSEIYV